MKNKSIKVTIRKEALVKTMEETVRQALRILKSFDRMPNNPDDSFLAQVVAQQLEELGLIRFFVFICPKFIRSKFKVSALFGKRPEEYMPIAAGEGDLFGPRISKMNELVEGLKLLGISAELNFIIGDNDAENYIFPFLPDVRINPKIFLDRQKLYEKSFEIKVRRLFGKSCIAWSLGCSGIRSDDEEPSISEEEMLRELRFFQWLFSQEGPYEGKLNFPEEILKEMVRLKFKLYGAQGKFLEELGGILLQTEGPGVWFQRTKMLRCTGSRAVPAIYPWIRQEELEEVGRERR